MSYSAAKTHFNYTHFGQASNDPVQGLRALAAGLKELTSAIEEDLNRIKAEIRNMQARAR
jgi:hypothetical protein